MAMAQGQGIGESSDSRLHTHQWNQSPARASHFIPFSSSLILISHFSFLIRNRRQVGECDYLLGD